MAGIGFGPRLVSQSVETGLAGTVTDSSGAVVMGAHVTVINTQTGERHESVTGADGSYRFTGLPSGTYDVSVTVTGFAHGELSDVSLTVGQSARADVKLTAGTKDVEPQRITSRHFLVGGSQEDGGYGLYSYVLLGSRPTDATRERVIALVREYLALPEAAELNQSVPKRQLNVTYLPLVKQPRAVEPDSVLHAYDYVRAQVLLAKVPMGPYVEGPYLISCEVPLTTSAIISGHYLYQDLSSVPPSVMVLWIREFMKQSSQKDYWRRRNGPHAALQLRAVIASLAVGVDPTKKSLKAWQGILTSLIFWKPETSKNAEPR